MSIDLSANLLSSLMYCRLFNSKMTAARVSILSTPSISLNMTFCSADDCPGKLSRLSSFLMNSSFILCCRMGIVILFILSSLYRISVLLLSLSQPGLSNFGIVSPYILAALLALRVFRASRRLTSVSTISLSINSIAKVEREGGSCIDL